MSETALATQNNGTGDSATCFDILKVSTLFESSLIGEDDVQMDAYLAAYEEIMK